MVPATTREALEATGDEENKVKAEREEEIRQLSSHRDKPWPAENKNNWKRNRTLTTMLVNYTNVQLRLLSDF